MSCLFFNNVQSVIFHFSMCILLVTVLMLIPVLTFGQNNKDQLTKSSRGMPYQVIKTNHSERFVFPFTSSNNERLNPLVYTYDKAKGPSWILTIQNNLSYNSGQDAKTIIKLREPTPSEKFVDIAMYNDDPSKRFWAAANTKEVGYVRLYDKKGGFGWSRNQPIVISYASNQGLTISSGTRIYVDKLSTNGFTLGSISVYGKDNPKSPPNTYEGDISFNVIYGDPASSPIYYLPLVTLVGMGGIVGGLLILKRRKAT
jgi:hypothetical protein